MGALLLPSSHRVCSASLAPSRHIPHPSTRTCTRTHSQTRITSDCRLGPEPQGALERARSSQQALPGRVDGVRRERG